MFRSQRLERFPTRRALLRHTNIAVNCESCFGSANRCVPSRIQQGELCKMKGWPAKKDPRVHEQPARYGMDSGLQLECRSAANSDDAGVGFSVRTSKACSDYLCIACEFRVQG